ncbi:exodeoxyribonuclease V subunit gamma [Vreelandella venusta]|uniref:exodeoxyribonuclease V subunit gamma n=1 Tax=Vreelandella venusta TaxID=44935 RepID=UPI003AA92232
MAAYSAPNAHEKRTQGLIVLQGNRMEDLRDVTMAWLAHRPLHPLEKTTFLVQSNGIAQWLKISMAETQGGVGRGISLGADVMLPARFQWQAYRQVIDAATGDNSVPKSSPFDKGQLRWQILTILPDVLKDPRFEPLARYLEEDPDTRKRYQLAERIADLFDQYQVYRADWLTAWEQGDDILTQGFLDSAARQQPLDDEHLWQPTLWRLLGDTIAERLGEEARHSHRGAIHQRFKTAANELSQRPEGLSPRIVVFGISSLPLQMIEVLAALSPLSEVILCLLNPCQHYWGDIIETRDALRRHHRQRRKQGMPADLHATPEALHLHAHPLLAAWGKQGRDYLHLLSEYDATEQYQDAFTALQQPVDCFVTPDTRYLLGQLQDDLLDLRPAAESQSRWPALSATDRSITFTVCHGAQRELEVLHDQLLASFGEDATLQPRDIIVMVPNINDYAPYIEAVFGQFSPHERRYLPYHLADQQRRHREPLLVALETLLTLPQRRFRTSEVLELLDIPPLRHAFGLEESDLPILQRWVRDTNIRWGLNAQQRASLDLPEHDELHTWRFGLERMLMGYAIGAPAETGDDWEGIVPFDEVAGLDARIAGSLYRLISALEDYRERLDTSQSADGWSAVLGKLIVTFLAPTSPREEQLLGHVQTTLDAWQQEIHDAQMDLPINLAVVRESWLSRIDEPQLAQNFIVGRVTFATLMPMRAIPFRHVYMLGMQEGAYPRKSQAPDFDLMAIRGHYRPGDRSRRDDDRYLFLEALLSARERLVISWCGFSAQDNQEQPPSVLVGQLRDHIAAGWRLAAQDTPARLSADEREKQRRSLLATLTVEHPLQPFGHAYFDKTSPLFTYAREWQGVRSTTSGPSLLQVSASLPLWQPESTVTLSALASFMRDPVSALFQQRLATSMRDDHTTSEDDEPFDFDSLEKWQQRDAILQYLGQRLTSDRNADIDLLFQETVDTRQREGHYPPSPVGPLVQHALLEHLPDTLSAYQTLLRRYPDAAHPVVSVSHAAEITPNTLAPFQHTQPVHITLSDTLDNVFCSETETARIVLLSSHLHQGNSWHWNQIMRHWPAHLALQLTHPESSTHLVSPSGTLAIPGFPKAQAAEWLDRLIRQWFSAMQAPLPTHSSLAFTLFEYAPDGVDPLDIEALCQNEKLVEEWEKAFDKLSQRSPMTVRELPTLEDFLSNDQFLTTCQDVYRDLYDWVAELTATEHPTAEHPDTEQEAR